MSEKLKVYSVSLLAFLPISDALELSFISEENSNGEMIYTEQLPALIPATSIEDAAELSKSHALERWKISKGWYGHQAAIMPVTKQFF